ncbi:hypothetical protein [Planomonospora algeriensis]
MAALIDLGRDASGVRVPAAAFAPKIAAFLLVPLAGWAIARLLRRAARADPVRAGSGRWRGRAGAGHVPEHGPANMAASGGARGAVHPPASDGAPRPSGEGVLHSVPGPRSHPGEAPPPRA